MPLYDYHCDACEQTFTAFKKLSEYREPVFCPTCPGVAQKRLSAPAVLGDYERYNCPVTGKLIEGRRQHEENLKRTGCRVYEAGETEALQRRKAQEEAAFDRAIEETVERTVEAMPTRQKEQLAAELQAGAGVEVVRGTSTGGV